MTSLNPYQIVLTGLLLGWLVAITLIWVRFDSLKQGRLVLIGVFVWPLLLADEWLKLSGYFTSMSFVAGLFQFVPAIIAAIIALAVRKLTLEKPVAVSLVYFVPAALLVFAQIPFVLLPYAQKVTFLYTPPVGDLLVNWPYLAPYLFSGFVLLIFAVQATESISHYHYHLSDQVVDVNFYRLNLLNYGCIGMIVVALLNILIVGLVTFDLFTAREWQAMVNILQASVFMFLLLVLLEKRRYSPAPFTPDQLANHKYSDDYLRTALKQAEKTIIKHKAYKRIGLRIRQVADAADIEPLALALATRLVLKRNFRAFIYHYRLEYAKKVLMRTDAKVSSVAKKLGFNSEKYLSSVFVKYIRTMGTDDIDNNKM